MKIWVDLATPPHVLFFRPIIAEFKRRGCEVIITTRHSTETVPLADKYGLAHTPIGAHGGGSLAGKGAAIVWRALKLVWFLRREKITVAVSHGSYSQALAGALMRVPVVALTDYEGHPGGPIVCRVARKMLVPHVFDKERLYRNGTPAERVDTYNGLKEDVYLSDFKPDPAFLERVGIPPDKILVTMRPASEVAAYHQFENPLFEEVLQYISQQPDTFTVVLPRTADQRQKYEARRLSNVLMPDQVLDGPNLIYYSDLVVGAGGTMNREAKALGTPVYNMFKGELGSVDRYLINLGKMVRIEDISDIDKIKICKKSKNGQGAGQNGHNGLVHEIVDKILAV